MAERPFPLIPQLRGDMAQTCSALHFGDPRDVVENDLIVPIKLKNEMAVFSAEPERPIAVPAAFGIGLDANLRSACHGVLHVLGGCRHGNRDGGVDESEVVRGGVELVVGAIGSIHRDLGGGEAFAECRSLVDGRRCCHAQEGKGRYKRQHGGLVSMKTWVRVPTSGLICLVQNDRGETKSGEMQTML